MLFLSSSYRGRSGVREKVLMLLSMEPGSEASQSSSRACILNSFCLICGHAWGFLGGVQGHRTSLPSDDFKSQSSPREILSLIPWLPSRSHSLRVLFCRLILLVTSYFAYNYTLWPHQLVFMVGHRSWPNGLVLLKILCSNRGKKQSGFIASSRSRGLR